MSPKANLEILYRTVFDWAVLVAWMKSHLICMSTTRINSLLCQRIENLWITEITMTWKSQKNCTWSLGNAKAKMSWSSAHCDTVSGNNLISSPAGLPRSAQREQLVNIVFYCRHSVDNPVISLLHSILIPSLGKNYHPACPYLGLLEYIQYLWFFYLLQRKFEGNLSWNRI